MVSIDMSVYAITGYDPTRTIMLRNAFARDLRARFAQLAVAVKKAIVDRDVFGLNVQPLVVMADKDKKKELQIPEHRAFDFPRSAEKVGAFMGWLESEANIGVLEVLTGQQLGRAVEKSWLNKYIESAYQRGILRGRQELRNAGYQVPTIDQTGGLMVAFNQPMHADRAGLIYTRAFAELRGITTVMGQQISRVLAQGIIEGRNPRELARTLVATITGPVGDLNLTDTLGRFIPAQRRAEILARTEVIRAHHVGTIQEYRNWGAAGVKVKAEWITAEDDRVCPECDGLQNKVFELDEIEGMIPLHPQCRCVAIPVDVTDEGV